MAKNLKLNPSIDTLKELKEYEIYSKKRQNEIKFESFKKYTETNLSRESDASVIWNTIHKFNNKKQSTFSQPDLETLNNMQNFIKEFCLNQHHITNQRNTTLK